MFSPIANALTLLAFVLFYTTLGAGVDSALKRRLSEVESKHFPLLPIIGFAVWPIIGFGLALIGWFGIGSEVLFLSILTIGVLMLVRQIWSWIARGSPVQQLREPCVVLILLILPITYFSFVSFGMFWAPAGDAVTHASLTAILQQGNLLPTAANSQTDLGIPLTSSSAISIAYPPGFPISAALMGVVTRLFPGRSVLLDAAFISSVIPVTIFRIGKSLTRSTFLGVLCSIFAFLLPDYRFSYVPSHDIVIANLINGTYPDHMGNLLVLGLLLLVVEQRVDDWRFSIIFAGLLIAYPPFLLYGVLIILLHLFSKLKVRGSKVGSVPWHTHLLRPAVLTMLGSLVLALALSLEVNAFITAVYGARSAYSVLAYGTPAIMKFPLVLLPLLACSTSVILLRRRGETSLFLSWYLALALILAVSLVQPIYDNAFFLSFPLRILPLFAITTISILIGAPRMLARTYSGMTHPHPFAYRFQMLILGLWNAIQRKRFARTLVAMSVLTIAVLAVFLPYVGFTPFSGNRITPAELQVLQEGLPSVPNNALILNDRTFAGLFLPSVELEQIVNIRSFVGVPQVLLQRALETNLFLNNPGNYSYANTVLHKWGVSYVFVGSDYYVLNLLSDGTYSGFVGKSWVPATYIAFFDNDPYLTPVARSDNSGLYRVL